MEGNGVISDLKQRLTSLLNKDINDRLIGSVTSFYKRSRTPDEFSTFMKVLGVDEENSKSIYNFVSGHIYDLETQLNRNNNSAPTTSSTSIHKEHLKLQPKLKKSKLALVFDDENEQVDEKPQSSQKFDTIKTTGAKVHKRVTLLFSDEEEEKEGPIKSGTYNKPFSFKKIKKEDALRIKQDVEMAPIRNEKSHARKPENLVPTKKTGTSTEPKKVHPIDPVDDESFSELKREDEILDFNIENDREWYMADEYGQAAKEDVENLEAIYQKPQTKFQVKKRIHLNKTGGGFNELTGEYTDYDHDQGGDSLFARIPITYHSFVPPFLEDTRKYLHIQLDDGTSARSIGPTINPIKDSTSELAVLAKTGSMVVKERKMKRERAAQAKERAGFGGSKIGNVLGGDDESVPTEKPLGYSEDNAYNMDVDDERRINDQRKSLPAFAVRTDLIRTIKENQVTIVIGETGSGKTTQLTQFLYEEGLGANLASDGERKMIGCTQPRRVAAMSVAKRVSEERRCVLGKEVGYAIRFEDKTDSQKTVIKYMTEGILLREVLMDPMLEKYSCIIMDEAHERSVNTDVLLGLFKQLVSRRRDLKLIITSATMNADRFTQFFGDAPQFTIPGRTFPVEVFFSKNTCSDYVEAAVKQILTIHLQTASKSQDQQNDGDILVFMTGQEDIEMTCQLLQEKLDMLENPPPLDILPIYSALPADLQKKIFSKSSSKRKVVVATNIAETSLTVDGIKYVVDAGLVKVKVYNPKLGMDTLQVVPISFANAQQRSGRAGRTGPGITYRLYTERAVEEDKMYLQPIPEIQRANLTNVLLLLKSLKVDDINLFPFLDPPPKDVLNCSLFELWSIGALDNFGDLTDLGRALTEFPIEPTLSKAIILSSRPEFNCSEEIITIVAMLSVPPVYFRPKERAEEADAAREKFLISESDHLTLLNVYVQWETNLRKLKNNYGKINSWCSRNFLQLKSLLRAKDIKNQLIFIMNKNRLPVVRSKSDDDIRKCLCASFFQQLAKLIKVNVNGSPEFINLRHNYMKMYLHPTSALVGSTPESIYVIYHELVLTTREYMNVVTVVDPLWLFEFGNKFFFVPDRYKLKILDKVDFELLDVSETQMKFKKDLDTYRKIQDSKSHKKKQLNVINDSKVGALKWKRRGI